MNIKLPNFTAPKLDQTAIQTAIASATRAAGAPISNDAINAAARAAAGAFGGGGVGCAHMGQRPSLLRRPIIPLRMTNSGDTSAGVNVGASTAVINALMANGFWTQAGTVRGAQSTKANRVIFSETFGHNLFSTVDGWYLRYLRAHLQVIARRAGQAFDPELSAQIKEALANALHVVVDPDNNDRNLSLDVMPFASFPDEGIILKPDQIAKVSRNMVIRLDYAGVGEADQYDLLDLTAGESIYVSVQMGVDVQFTPNADDALGDLF